MKIYLDNAATSYPKPSSVIKAARSSLSGFYGNSGRSGHSAAINSAEAISSAREEIASLFSLSVPENVCFTYNTTYALNQAILGSIQGCKKTVLTTSLEHNSVLRPLYFLESEGKIDLIIIDVPDDDEKLLSLIRENIPVIDIAVMTAASNVTGRRLPVKKIGELLKKNGVLYIVDAAQAVGNMTIDASSFDILCAPAHKGLFGFTGLGFTVINPSSPLPFPIISGGSGTKSKRKTMPDILPERLEAGTVNVFGAIALAEGVRYVKKRTQEKIFEHEKILCKELFDRLSDMKGITVYSNENSNILLFNVDGLDCFEVENGLCEKDICVRSGYHCAPLIHERLKTDSGAVRVSFGAFNTKNDVTALADAVFYMTKK